MLLVLAAAGVAAVLIVYPNTPAASIDDRAASWRTGAASAAHVVDMATTSQHEHLAPVTAIRPRLTSSGEPVFRDADREYAESTRVIRGMLIGTGMSLVAWAGIIAAVALVVGGGWLR